MSIVSLASLATAVALVLRCFVRWGCSRRTAAGPRVACCAGELAAGGLLLRGRDLFGWVQGSKWGGRGSCAGGTDPSYPDQGVGVHLVDLGGVVLPPDRWGVRRWGRVLQAGWGLFVTGSCKRLLWVGGVKWLYLRNDTCGGIPYS